LATNEYSILNDHTYSISFGKMIGQTSAEEGNFNLYYDDVMEYDFIEFFYDQKFKLGVHIDHETIPENTYEFYIALYILF